MMRARTIGNMLAISAFVLWLFSIWQAKLTISRGIGSFGLTSVLPITFSASLLVFSFFVALKSDEQDRILLFFQTIILILILNLTPALVENTARFTTTYTNYRAVDCVSENKHIDPAGQWRHNWPSFSIAYSALMQITTLPDQILLMMYPTFFNIALFFPLSMLFQSLLDDEKSRWIAIWCLYIASWVGQDYFSMQSLGFLTSLLIFFILFKLMDSQVSIRQWSVVLVLLFSLTVTSHMLSSLVILAIFFVFFVSKHLQRTVLVTLFASIFGSWTIYGAATYVEWNLPRLVAEVLNFELIYLRNLEARIAGSTAHMIVTQVRLIFSALFIGFAFLGFLLTWKRGRIGDSEKRMLFLLIGVASLAGFSAYGGELFMRVFLFSLVALSYFISKGSNEKIFFCLFAIFLIAFAPPLHMIAHYGNEVMDYVPPSEIRGIEFFHKETTRGYVVGPYRDSKYRASYKYVPFASTEWKNNTLSLGPIRSEHVDWPHFICISYGVREYYNFLRGEPEFIVETTKNLSESVHYDLIYSNPSFEVYLESRQ